VLHKCSTPPRAPSNASSRRDPLLGTDGLAACASPTSPAAQSPRFLTRRRDVTAPVSMSCQLAGAQAANPRSPSARDLPEPQRFLSMLISPPLRRQSPAWPVFLYSSPEVDPHIQPRTSAYAPLP
jgi:hypothetical protein